MAGKAATAPATDIESKTVFRPAVREAVLPAQVVNPPNRTTVAGAVPAAARSALPFAPQQRPAGVQAVGDGMAPKQRPVKLLVAGAAALVLVLIAAVLLTAGILDRRRGESIELALGLPDLKSADDAVMQLSRVDEHTRVAVRQIIATLEPGDPLLRDSRAPLAFRDAAAAALAKRNLD